MATTQQISLGDGSVSGVLDRYKGDDWPFYFQQTGADLSVYTWTASLITEPGGVYTVTSIAGGNGSIDQSHASAGIVYVTISDTLTSTLTEDVESVNLAASTQTVFLTRLALLGTQGTVTQTFAIVPIRVIKR